MKKGKNVKKYPIIIFIAGIFLLCVSIYYGKNKIWISFGINLGVGIMSIILYALTLLSNKIDLKFDRLEKLIQEKNFKEK